MYLCHVVLRPYRHYALRTLLIKMRRRQSSKRGVSESSNPHSPALVSEVTNGICAIVEKMWGKTHKVMIFI